MDLIPLIKSWTLECGRDTMTIDAVLNAQNPGLNPELIRAAFCEKYPHHDTLKAQYAYCLLRDNRAEEALVILQNLLEKSPDLFCARTYLVEIATTLKRLELAKHYINTAEVPLSIHAGIYLKWQNALASYYKATGEKAHQKVARKRAQQALDAIREEIEESFDD